MYCGLYIKRTQSPLHTHTHTHTHTQIWPRLWRQFLGTLDILPPMHHTNHQTWLIFDFLYEMLCTSGTCVLSHAGTLRVGELVSSQPHMDRVLVTHLWADVMSLYHYLLEHRSLCVSVVGGLLYYHLFDVASFIDRSTVNSTDHPHSMG